MPGQHTCLLCCYWSTSSPHAPNEKLAWLFVCQIWLLSITQAARERRVHGVWHIFPPPIPSPPPQSWKHHHHHTSANAHAATMHKHESRIAGCGAASASMSIVNIRLQCISLSRFIVHASLLIFSPVLYLSPASLEPQKKQWKTSISARFGRQQAVSVQAHSINSSTHISETGQQPGRAAAAQQRTVALLLDQQQE